MYKTQVQKKENNKTAPLMLLASDQKSFFGLSFIKHALLHKFVRGRQLIKIFHWWCGYDDIKGYLCFIMHKGKKVKGTKIRNQNDHSIQCQAFGTKVISSDTIFHSPSIFFHSALHVPEPLSDIQLS